MTNWRKKGQTLTLMLLILLMGTAAVSPSGIHLELCLGYDGHINFKTDTCLPDTIPRDPVSDTFGSEHEHPEDCLDLAVGCSSSDQVIPSWRFAKTGKKNIQPFLSHAFYRSDTRSFPFTLPNSIKSTLPTDASSVSPYPLSLRTTVLII